MPERAAPAEHTREQEVLDAAARVVAAFGAHRTEEYFACFAPQASFLFHTHPTLLADRQAYRDVWAGWEGDGFRVLGCRSRQGSVLMLDDDHAVFTHRVRTSVATADSAASVEAERETMVFARTAAGDWLVVHEHLSPDPQPDDEEDR